MISFLAVIKSVSLKPYIPSSIVDYHARQFDMQNILAIRLLNLPEQLQLADYTGDFYQVAGDRGKHAGNTTRYRRYSHRHGFFTERELVHEYICLQDVPSDSDIYWNGGYVNGVDTPRNK